MILSVCATRSAGLLRGGTAIMIVNIESAGIVDSYVSSAKVDGVLMFTRKMQQSAVPTGLPLMRPKTELVKAAKDSLDKVNECSGPGATGRAAMFAFPFRIVIEQLDGALSGHLSGAMEQARSGFRSARGGLDYRKWTLSSFYSRGSDRERPDERSVNGECDNTSALIAVMRQISEHLTCAIELFEQNRWNKGTVAFGVALQFCVTAARIVELESKSPS